MKTSKILTACFLCAILYACGSSQPSAKWENQKISQVEIDSAKHRLILERISRDKVEELEKPNPFCLPSILRFWINKPDTVSLSIYNIKGIGGEIFRNQVDSGGYEIKVATLVSSSGIYFYRLKTPNWTETKRLIIIK